MLIFRNDEARPNVQAYFEYLFTELLDSNESCFFDQPNKLKVTSRLPSLISDFSYLNENLSSEVALKDTDHLTSCHYHLFHFFVRLLSFLKSVTFLNKSYPNFTGNDENEIKIWTLFRVFELSVRDFVMPLIGSSKHFLRLKRLMRPGQLFQQQKLTILKLFNYWLVAKVGVHWLKRSMLPTRIRNMNCFKFQSTICQMQLIFPIATMINLTNWYQFVELF